MVRRVGVFVLVASFVVLAGVVPARAQTSVEVDDAPGLAVTLVADQPVVTVDRDAPRDQVVYFEVVVRNDGDAVAPSVVVECALLGGTPLRHDVGDVAPGGEWRQVVEASIPASTTGGGPLDSVATARSSDGRAATSLPARVEVQVISSEVIDRTPAPSPDVTIAPAASPVSTAVETQVLGATYERGAASELARSGAPLAALGAVGVVLVALGGLLVRRSAIGG